jgi:tetratricopeptide (TPR) repeat protein
VNRNALPWALIGLGLLVLFLAAALILTGASRSNQRAMDAANQLAEAGHYAEAAQMYEQLVREGARDAALFHNLGNAYFQQGDLPRALLGYELAAQFNPRSPDIRTNLELARTQAGLASATPPASPLAILLEASRRWLSLNELALLALGLWLLFGFLVFTYRQFLPGQRPALLRYAAMLVLAGVLVTGAALAMRMLTQPLPSDLMALSQVATSGLQGVLP